MKCFYGPDYFSYEFFTPDLGLYTVVLGRGGSRLRDLGRGLETTKLSKNLLRRRSRPEGHSFAQFHASSFSRSGRLSTLVDPGGSYANTMGEVPN